MLSGTLLVEIQGHQTEPSYGTVYACGLKLLALRSL